VWSSKKQSPPHYLSFIVQVSKTLLLIQNELRQQLLSSATWVAGVVFLVPMVLFFWVVVKDYSEFARDELPVIAFYRVFWIPNLFVIPLLTMRSIAEERRMGTLETLMTTPIQPAQLVIAKFGAAWLTYLALWLLTLLFPAISYALLGQEALGVAFASPANTLGCMLFISLSGACFVAIGILSSSLTRSQLVAGMLAFTGVFLVIVSGRMFEEIPFPGSLFGTRLGSLGEYLQTFAHFEWFARGIIDLRPVIYYVSSTLGMLALATNVVERKI
jgi:ABC-2 type transport system permease protein